MALPVFVINLDRRPDRLATISDNLDRIGVSFTRVSAIDAASLLPPRKRQHMSLGAQACKLSHCKALAAFLETGSPAALILEDDAEIASDTASVLASVDWWPKGHGLLKLEVHGRKPRILGARKGRTPTGRDLRTMYHGHAGVAGYLIDCPSARIVLEACSRRPLRMDSLIFGLHRSATARQLRPLQIVPAMIRQRPSPSDIKPSTEAAKEAGMLPNALKGGPGELLHNLTIAILRASGKVEKCPVAYSDTP